MVLLVLSKFPLFCPRLVIFQRRSTLPCASLLFHPRVGRLSSTVAPVNPPQDVKPMFTTGAVIVMLTAVAVHLKLKSVYSKLIRSYQARQVASLGDTFRKKHVP